MRFMRIIVSPIASWRAWPVCSRPVTFGGGWQSTYGVRVGSGSASYSPSSSHVRCQRSSTPRGSYLGCMLSPPLIERPILWAGGGYAGTMQLSLPAGRVALHAARIRGRDDLAAFALDGAHTAERPGVGDGDLMAAAAEVGDHVVAEARLD